MERRLAAVLIADVVGYGRLSQIDDEGTRARFQADMTDVFEPGIAAHHGRLVKTMGDGLLVEFHSVVDALRCAVEVQTHKAERNAVLPPQLRLDFRIGLNLGDVIIEGDDIHGDGVNIADRLQGLAEPGGIAISGTAYDHVRAKLPVGFVSLGDQRVKSIDEPVRVYRVVLDPASAGKTIGSRRNLRSWRLPAAAAIVGALLVAGVAVWQLQQVTGSKDVSVLGNSRPSLVVLPFNNMSDDKEQGYLADGITEDLTTELARVPGLFVISRNAAFAFKGKAIKPAEVAAALGVRYLLEGSIRRVGDDVRINAQLIDSATAGHLWAERFDGRWSDVFTLQDKVVGSIAGTLELRLIRGQRKADAPGGTSNPAAYEAYLRGSELESRNTPEDIVKAATYYQQALQLDPNFGTAVAALAWLYWNLDEPRLKALGITWDEQETKLHEFLNAAAKHPSPTYYQIAAEQLVRQRQSDEAIALLQKAVALDPSHPWTYEGLSQALIFNGKPKEGRSYLDAALQVDPGWTDWRYYQAGLADFGQGRFEEAAASLEKIDVGSPDPWAKFYGLQVLLSAYGHLGRADLAAVAREKLAVVLMERNEGELTQLFSQAYFVFKNEVDIVRLLAGLAKAGVPELQSDVELDPNNRLTGSEIRSLFFGHEVRGHRLAPRLREFRVIISANGTITATVGDRSSDGMSWVQGDFWCDAYPGSIASCTAVFRNPTGTTEQQNEYQLIGRWNRHEFSVVR